MFTDAKFTRQAHEVKQTKRKKPRKKTNKNGKSKNKSEFAANQYQVKRLNRRKAKQGASKFVENEIENTFLIHLVV